MRLEALLPRAVAGLSLALLAGAAPAWEADRSLAPWQRTAAPAQRSTAVEPLEWERRLRSADRMGPVPLRSADAALLAAARASRWEEALRLVKTGQAAANARDDSGGHTLVLAARAGQDELVRELLKRGADIDRVNDDGFNALGAAAFAARRSTVRLLLLAGADPQRQGASGQTALHLAAMGGQLNVMEELLRLKVDIEGLNRQRESALDVAANAGQQEAMSLLIDAGADANRAGRR